MKHNLKLALVAVLAVIVLSGFKYSNREGSEIPAMASRWRFYTSTATATFATASMQKTMSEVVVWATAVHPSFTTPTASVGKEVRDD